MSEKSSSDELRDLLMRIDDSVLRDQIIRALERRKEITPEAVLEEIRKAVDQLNNEAALRRAEEALRPLVDEPRPSQRRRWVPVDTGPQMYGPQIVGRVAYGPLEVTRTGDGTGVPDGTVWYDRIVSGTEIMIDTSLDPEQ